MADPIMSTVDVQANARALLRQWLASGETEVLRAIDAIGRNAIASAASASARLGRGVTAARIAEQGLQNIEILARSLEAPPPRTRFRFGRERDRPAPNAPSIASLLEQLDRERDAVARGLLEIETDRTRLRAAGGELDGVLALVRACVRAVEAAAREIAPDQPNRARFLRDGVAARLLAREQDIVTQAAVTAQGVLTLAVVAESHDALAQALGRARTTSIAALRTAAAAREAVAGSAAIAAQAAALDDSAGSAAIRSALHRSLDEAIAQARRAIDAGRTAP